MKRLARLVFVTILVIGLRPVESLGQRPNIVFCMADDYQ